jgi:hypothetical protein
MSCNEYCEFKVRYLFSLSLSLSLTQTHTIHVLSYRTSCSHTCICTRSHYYKTIHILRSSVILVYVSYGEDYCAL